MPVLDNHAVQTLFPFPKSSLQSVLLSPTISSDIKFPELFCRWSKIIWFIGMKQPVSFYLLFMSRRFPVRLGNSIKRKLCLSIPRNPMIQSFSSVCSGHLIYLAVRNGQPVSPFKKSSNKKAGDPFGSPAKNARNFP